MVATTGVMMVVMAVAVSSFRTWSNQAKRYCSHESAHHGCSFLKQEIAPSDRKAAGGRAIKKLPSGAV
jgi:hypothetical protein